eukprot:SAG31_NODE_719_length_12605_cov_22.378858_7_plen_94_part_00
MVGKVSKISAARSIGAKLLWCRIYLESSLSRCIGAHSGTWAFARLHTLQLRADLTATLATMLVHKTTGITRACVGRARSRMDVLRTPLQLVRP